MLNYLLIKASQRLVEIMSHETTSEIKVYICNKRIILKAGKTKQVAKPIVRTVVSSININSLVFQKHSKDVL